MGALIQQRDTNYRKAVAAEVKLAVTLRYLASGSSWDTLSYLYRVPKCTISKFIPEVCAAIFGSLQSSIQVRKKQANSLQKVTKKMVY